MLNREIVKKCVLEHYVVASATNYFNTETKKVQFCHLKPASLTQKLQHFFNWHFNNICKTNQPVQLAVCTRSSTYLTDNFDVIWCLCISWEHLTRTFLVFHSSIGGISSKTKKTSEITTAMCSSYLQGFFIKRSQFVLHPVSWTILWGGISGFNKNRRVIQEMIWGWVLGTWENLHSHRRKIIYQHPKIKTLSAWLYFVNCILVFTFVAFLLPLILSTRAWASLIRSVMLCSCRRFFSTLSETLVETNI